MFGFAMVGSRSTAATRAEEEEMNELLCRGKESKGSAEGVRNAGSWEYKGILVLAVRVEREEAPRTRAQVVSRTHAPPGVNWRLKG